MKEKKVGMRWPLTRLSHRLVIKLGMRWPITRLSLANDTSVVCPLCMYGYILPDSPEGDGHVTGMYVSTGVPVLLYMLLYMRAHFNTRYICVSSY